MAKEVIDVPARVVPPRDKTLTEGLVGSKEEWTDWRNGKWSWTDRFNFTVVPILLVAVLLYALFV